MRVRFLRRCRDRSCAAANPVLPEPDANEHSGCFRTIGSVTVVKILDGQSVPFAANGQGRTINIGSVSTIDAVPKSFGVRGSDLRLEEQSMAITRSVTNCLEEPNLKFTLMVSYTAQ